MATDADYISGPDWMFNKFGTGNFQGENDVTDALWKGCYGLIARANMPTALATTTRWTRSVWRSPLSTTMSPTMPLRMLTATGRSFVMPMCCSEAPQPAEKTVVATLLDTPATIGNWDPTILLTDASLTPFRSMDSTL